MPLVQLFSKRKIFYYTFHKQKNKVYFYNKTIKIIMQYCFVKIKDSLLIFVKRDFIN